VILHETPRKIAWGHYGHDSRRE